MDNGFQVLKESIADREAGIEFLDRIYEIAQPNAILSEPVTQGDYTVITATEVSLGIGYGFGAGGGSSTEGGQEETAEESAEGFGSGGGGGGGVAARPVAAIEIGPHGVRVEPIVDPTKIAIAFFTAFGAMFMMLNRMRKQARG